MEHKYLTFYKELDELKERANLNDSFQEQEKTHNAPSTMAAWVTELEAALEAEKKWRQDVFNVAIEMTRHVEEDQ